LHDHFVDPAVVERGRYVAPTAPGFSAQMLDTTLEHYRFPDGPAWTGGAVKDFQRKGKP